MQPLPCIRVSSQGCSELQAAADPLETELMTQAASQTPLRQTFLQPIRGPWPRLSGTGVSEVGQGEAMGKLEHRGKEAVSKQY